MATAIGKTARKGGKPDVAALMKPTAFHPEGRVKIDPVTREVVNPKNNVLRTKTKILKHESGIELGRIEIPVNGGHVLAEGSVWRNALGGPSKYHKRVVDDNFRFRERGKKDRTAPELEYTEAKEYEMFKAYLTDTEQTENIRGLLEGAKETPRMKEEYKNIDADFYAWVKEAKAKVVVDVKSGGVDVEVDEVVMEEV